MEAEIDLTELEDLDSNERLDIFALRTLARVIALEERKTGRMSGLRVFCRVDVSLYRESEGGSHRYFVNEITRTHGAALFPNWDVENRLGFLFNHMSNTLHYISAKKLYQQPPIPFFQI